MAFAKIFMACALISGFNIATCIKCFSCAVTEELLTMGYKRMLRPPCSKFDRTQTYIIDCPYSTMCSRIISTMFLQNGHEQKTITLGCAHQKLLSHVLYNGKWKEELSVQEIYTEDCQTMKTNNMAGAVKTYCYCRSDLCNSANNKFDFFNGNKLLLSFLIIKISF